jgi:signal transduction histidine kinase/ActR/RegA family two-component response regulator
MGFDFQLFILSSGLMCGALVFAGLSFVKLRRFHDALAVLDHGIIRFDRSGGFKTANKAAFVFLPILKEGQAPKRLNLRVFLDYLFDHAVEADRGLLQALEKASLVNQSTGFREVVNYGEGRVCMVESRETLCGETVVIVQDLTVFWQEQNRLIGANQANQELAFAVESATNAIVVLNRSENYATPARNKIMSVNRAFCELMQMKRSDLIGQDFSILESVCSDDESRDAIRSDEHMDHGDVSDFQIKTAHNDVTQWFNVKIKTENNKAQGSDLRVCVFTNMTELYQKDQQVYKAQKLDALGRLAAGVAHDFNNILSIIQGYARMVGGADDAEKRDEFSEKIMNAALRGADLTQKMLMFSSHQVVNNDVIDLNESLHAVRQLLAPLIQSSIDVRYAGHEGVLPIKGTDDNIAQIVMNLMINARDAMPNGGVINAETFLIDHKNLPADVAEKIKSDQAVCLCVSDTGSGIHDDVLDRIFDPFFTTKAPDKGTGLGLSVVYGLVQQMGGSLHVQSRLGEGTSFRIYWSLGDEAKIKKVSGDLTNTDTVRFDGLTILVAEDEPDLLSLMQSLLEDAGAKVLAASNGNQALLLQDECEDHIDILITDVMMPEMNGIKLAEMFEALRPASKIIFMSGYPADKTQTNSILPENAVFLAKPVPYDVLVRKMFQVLGMAVGDDTGANQNDRCWDNEPQTDAVSTV